MQKPPEWLAGQQRYEVEADQGFENELELPGFCSSFIFNPLILNSHLGAPILLKIP
jgi:hypothetical protein